MLKIIKYDLKSMGIIAAVFGLAVIIADTVFCIRIANTVVEQATDAEIFELFTYGWELNVGFFILFSLVAAGNMWKRVAGNTELYEMAGVSPLKVGAARLLIVFTAVTLFSYLLMLGDSIMCKIYYSKNTFSTGIGASYFRRLSDIATGTMFAINGLKWTNIFTPLFAGLNISILFSTSFLFSTLTRRFDNKLASALVLGSLVALVLTLNFSVLNKINIYLPELNLNKLGVGGPIIERFGRSFAGNDYGDLLYLINPNLLNMGLLLFQALYVALMFSVYSIRRKAV